MVDINNLSDQESFDVATRNLWNALPKAAQADIADHMTPEERAEVRSACGRAKKITGR